MNGIFDANKKSMGRGRGRGFVPARDKSPERPGGRYSGHDEPQKNEGKIDYWTPNDTDEKYGWTPVKDDRNGNNDQGRNRNNWEENPEDGAYGGHPDRNDYGDRKRNDRDRDDRGDRERYDDDRSDRDRNGRDQYDDDRRDRGRYDRDRYDDDRNGRDRYDDDRKDRGRYDRDRYDDDRNGRDQYDDDRKDRGRYDRDRYDDDRNGRDQYDDDRKDRGRYDRDRYDDDRNGRDRNGDDRKDRGRYDRDRYDDDRNGRDRYDDDRNGRDRYDDDRKDRGRYDRDRYDDDRNGRDRYDDDRKDRGRYDRDRYDDDRSDRDRNGRDRNDDDRFSKARSDDDRFDRNRNEDDRFSKARSDDDRFDRDRKDKGRFDRNRNGKESKNASGFGGSHGNEDKPKPSLYIPKRPTEDDEEIFGSGISSGINFDKYDDIEVNVSGEDPPQPIRTFDESGVQDVLLGLIKRCKYTKPTPIQKYSIPIVMAGRDMMACAQTGSGKTAAFLIPIMNKLLQMENFLGPFDRICRPQALVVAPTRELAIQIFNEARKFSRGCNLTVELAYGGTSVFHQVQLLTRKEVDFVVATPGRLLDIIRRGKLKCSRLRFCVLDEADRMLDMGFLPAMEDLMDHIKTEAPDERQVLMFSATFPEEIQHLAGRFLRDYLFVAVGAVGGACSDVDQTIYKVTKFEKREKLFDLLDLMEDKCLVFVEQKRTTDFIAAFLSEKQLAATSIHGGREQREREEALNDFKEGRMMVLVATSVAARGLDIKDVAHVVNYDLPKTIDEYVHRIGRTGRVGNRGSAISFFDENDDHLLAPELVRILKQTGHQVPEFLEKYNRANGFVNSRFGGRDVRGQESKRESEPEGEAEGEAEREPERESERERERERERDGGGDEKEEEFW